MMRLALAGEIATVLDWAAAEGWNPGRDDAAAFRAADPAGFFVAERDGAPVAAISVVNHAPDMAFLGLYLCLPDWRGQGIGYALWQHALAHAGGRTVGLDGVAAQQANYAKSGFAHAGASVRYEGTLAGAHSSDVRPAAPADLPVIEALDRAANGYARPAFLAAWTTPTETRRTFLLEDGTGFATVRACRDGVKIGPIVAPDQSAALMLARAALGALPAERAIIDLPASNRALADVLERLGFVETFATARMYRGAAPTASQSLQAISTMELG